MDMTWYWLGLTTWQVEMLDALFATAAVRNQPLFARFRTQTQNTALVALLHRLEDLEVFWRFVGYIDLTINVAGQRTGRHQHSVNYTESF